MTPEFNAVEPNNDVISARRDSLTDLGRKGAADGPYAPRWPSLQKVGTAPWYAEAKFGIFIHWLVSSVPAYGSEWYARNMYVPGTPEFEHHRETYGAHTDFGFKDFIPQFTGEKFDADAWIALVKRSGAQYVVPVAEHHDGYALYDSDLTRWKAPNVGPLRDVIGELSEAARRQGVTFGVSNHRAENWWFFNGGTRYDSDVLDPAFSDLYGPARSNRTQPDRDFLEDWFARLVETVEKYDPQVIYFDWWIEQPAFRPYLAEFAAYYYNRAARTGRTPVINYKWQAFDLGAGVYDIERGTADGIQSDFFQNDTSSSRIGWAHLSNNEFKTPEELVGELIDVVSKNGALLLNIGPRPDGTITAEEIGILKGIGDWLAVNGEAIYSTQPWITFGEGPTRPPLGSFSDTSPTAWTAQDVRFTSRGDSVVYAAYFVWPGDEAIVRSLGSDLRLLNQRISRVTLLGHGDIPWRLESDGLHADLSGVRRRAASPVFKIEVEEPRPVPRFEPDFPQ